MFIGAWDDQNRHGGGRSETMRDAPKAEIEASVLATIEAINAVSINTRDGWRYFEL